MINTPNTTNIGNFLAFAKASQVGFSSVVDPDAAIKAMFTGGKQGVFYNILPTHLWQDTARTIPVTANGNPVRVVDDLSGNGNHAIAPSSAARPIYRTDGILHWLESDGVDDYFDSPIVPWNGASFYQAIAVQITGGQTYGGVFRFLRSGGSAVSVSDNYFEEYSGSPWYRRAVVQRYPAMVTVYDSNPIPQYASHVSWTTNSANGAKTQVIPTQATAVDLGVKNLASGDATLSLFRGYGGQHMSGKLFGFIWVSGTVTDAERDSANNYLMQKSGVY